MTLIGVLASLGAFVKVRHVEDKAVVDNGQ